ncbi:MAG TPA: HAD-IIB family hydrolase [Polyangiaceae bacterium]
MLVTDLDGTLLDSNGRIHRADAEAIAALLKRGVPVSICTGRMYSGTRQIAQQLRLTGPIACVDGSHIVDTAARRSLFTATLQPTASEALRGLLEQLGLAAFAFASDAIIHDSAGQRFLHYLRTWSERMTPVKNLTSVEGWGSLKDVSAVVALGPQTQIEAVVAGLLAAAVLDGKLLQHATFPLRVPIGNADWAVIVRCASVDKGTATAWLAKHHGVPLDQVVAVGDWLNDVPMFKVVGKAFVMAQAPAEVRESAHFVLNAHTQVGGGIREAAERAGLL